MTTLTVLVSDFTSGSTDPFMYVVNVPDDCDEDAIMASVREQRSADTGKNPSDLDLYLLLAFKGKPELVRDWRD